jgi:dienelactone hydrolase
MFSIACRYTIAAVIGALAGTAALPAQKAEYRTLNDRLAPPRDMTLAEWNVRAAWLREHVLASAGLLPMPVKAPLNAQIFDTITRADYTVSKVYFESLPGFFVTGNLYRPIGKGPFPAVLSPHGHWAYGRLENTHLNSGPGRAIGLARLGFVVFSHDMIGYNDSRQLPHTFGGRREGLWGLSLAGLQLWNSIRAIDFLESLPDVRKDAIAATGESGGGTQTFLLAAIDSRVAVAAPVNMISLHMQGGCLCENAPGLRLETTNVEIAASIAPRPLLMIAATGDWTKDTLEVEYPAVRKIYDLFDAGDRVHAVRMDADHNYNRESREAMYAWMVRWLRPSPDTGAPGTTDAAVDLRVSERPFTPEPLQDLLVFHGRPLPESARSASRITEAWIDAARAQLEATPEAFTTTLRHVLGFGDSRGTETPPAAARRAAGGQSRAVLLASSDAALESALIGAGFAVERIAFTPFDAAAASKIRHFDTYNRTPASQRVADIVSAIRRNPGAPLVADGDAGLAGLLAVAIEDVPLAVLDAGRFDRSSDAAFVERLDIPGLRRAGDVQTAAAMVRGTVVVHNGGDSLRLPGIDLRAERLAPDDIAAALQRVR